MKSCAFFGHGKEDYEAYKEYIEIIIIDLIEKRGITQFYSGGRGAFDITCAKIVRKSIHKSKTRSCFRTSPVRRIHLF